MRKDRNTPNTAITICARSSTQGLAKTKCPSSTTIRWRIWPEVRRKWEIVYHISREEFTFCTLGLFLQDRSSVGIRAEYKKRFAFFSIVYILREQFL
jgi:hypothetical protein